jgi:hypothetical protein
MVRWSVFAGLLAIWLPGPVAPAEARQDRATTPGIPATAAEAPVAELLERLDALQRRVEALEQQLAASKQATGDARTAAAAPQAAPPAASDAEHAHPTAMLQGAGQPESYPSLRIHGFGDVNFVHIDDGEPRGFQMGQLVLHMASALGSKVSVFAETSLAPRAPVEGQPSGYVPDVERAIVRYDYNDAFKLSFGRYHTPIGYWNNAYHHGLFLQTTISRPEQIQFGTPFQPVHFVGVLAEGQVPGTRLGLGYRAGLGNGRGPTGAGDGGDVNDHRAWVGNVFSRPEGLPALEVGVSLYRDRYAPQPGPSVDEWITAAHLAWTNETPEIIAEFTNVRHTIVTSGRTFNNPAYYLQAAYRLPWRNARWKPYVRFENIDTSPDEPLVSSYEMRVSTAGVRFDLADFAAFKGEYRRMRRPRGSTDDAMNGWFLQTSFTF